MKSGNNIFFKRIILVLTVLLGLVVMVTSFSGCLNQNNSKRIIAIKIQTNPSKTSYSVGEALSVSGMVVYNIYEDESEEVTDDYTVNPPEGTIFNETGMQIITVEKVITSLRRKDIHRATFDVMVN